MEKINYYCPLLDGEEITDAECCDVCLVAEDAINERVIDDKYKKKDNYKDICLSCEYHNQ